MNTCRAVGAVLVVAACARGDSEGGASGRVHVVDSAGVQLVHNLDRTVDTAAVRLVERLRIGNVDGPEELQFHQVAGVVSDSAGRILVIDQGTRAVRLFDTAGRLVRTFGRPGIGPGEFERIGALFLWRDTIHVADRRRWRHALFDTTGTLLTSFTTRLPNGSSLFPLNGGPGGWYFNDDSLFSRGQGRDVAGTMTQTSSQIVRLDPRLIATATASRAAADSLVSPVAAFKSPRIFWRLGSEGGSERFPLGNTPYFEPSPSIAVDHRGLVYITAGWPYQIDVYDSTGAVVRRITRAHDSIPVTDGMVDEVLRRARAYYDTIPGRAFMVESYEAQAGFPRIGFVPVAGTLRVSPDGWLWVRRLDIIDDPVAVEWTQGPPPRSSYWDVFDPDGRFHYTVGFPPRFLLYDIRADGVIGVQPDELDVPYIVRYGVQPTAR